MLLQEDIKKLSSFLMVCPAVFYTQAFPHSPCKPFPDPCLGCPHAAEIQSHDLTNTPVFDPKS